MTPSTYAWMWLIWALVTLRFARVAYRSGRRIEAVADLFVTGVFGALLWFQLGGPFGLIYVMVVCGLAAIVLGTLQIVVSRARK